MLSYRIPKLATFGGGLLPKLEELRHRRHGGEYPRPPIQSTVPWDKVQFTHWVEKVKERYKVSQVVAMACNPPQEDKLPPLYRITYISELYSNTSFDTVFKEPICLTLMPRYGGVAVTRCPSVVRPLTEKEIELVKLQDTKA